MTFACIAAVCILFKSIFACHLACNWRTRISFTFANSTTIWILLKSVFTLNDALYFRAFSAFAYVATIGIPLEPVFTELSAWYLACLALTHVATIFILHETVFACHGTCDF